MKPSGIVPALIVLFLSHGIACAGVVEVTPQGFLLSMERTVQAKPGDAYKALLRVGDWWDPGHTYSGNSGNLSINPVAGGCFCEQLPDGGQVQHMTVVNLLPGRLLRMTGGLGPLQGHGLSGSLTWEFVETPQGATIRLTYSVGGYMQGGFAEMAPAVDAVLGAQLDRLTNIANE